MKQAKYLAQDIKYNLQLDIMYAVSHEIIKDLDELIKLLEDEHETQTTTKHQKLHNFDW